MIFLIGLIGLLIGFLVNNYTLSVNEEEKGNVFKFQFDKFRTPVIFAWNILIPVFLFKMYYETFSVNFFRDAILSVLCSAVFFIDFKLHIIPNILNLITFIFGVILVLFDINNFADNCIGAAIGFGFFVLIIILSKLIYKKDGMGLGDAKFMGVVGIMLGTIYTVTTIFFSFIFGAIGACIALASKNKKMGQEIAFGPYIVIASMIMILFGDNILMWYFGM